MNNRYNNVAKSRPTQWERYSAALKKLADYFNIKFQVIFSLLLQRQGHLPSDPKSLSNSLEKSIPQIVVETTKKKHSFFLFKRVNKWMSRTEHHLFGLWKEQNIAATRDFTVLSMV